MSAEYSVLLMRPPEGARFRDDTWLGVVRAMSPGHAAIVAQRVLRKEEEHWDDNDLEVLAVFFGRVVDNYMDISNDLDYIAQLDAELAAEGCEQ